MKKRWAVYAMAVSIPLLLGLQAWQERRYAVVEAQLTNLERSQADWIESNKRLIAGMAALGSAERIERVAREELGLKRIKPEAVLQVKLARSGRNDG